MKSGIKCKVGDLACVRPADFHTAVDYFKLQLDAARRALEAHMEKKGQPMHSLEGCVATIELEDGCFKFAVRDEVDGDKKNMPYFAEIRYPSIGSLSAFDMEKKDV